MAHGLGRAASYNSFGIRVWMTMILETHWDKIVILAYVSRFIEVFHYFGTRFHDSDEQNKGIFRVYFFFTLFGWITVMKTDELEAISVGLIAFSWCIWEIETLIIIWSEKKKFASIMNYQIRFHTEKITSFSYLLFIQNRVNVWLWMIDWPNRPKFVRLLEILQLTSQHLNTNLLTLNR